MMTPDASHARTLRPDAFAHGLPAAEAVRLLGAASDFCLIVEPDGTIFDAACGLDAGDLDVMPWIGRAWADTVTIESRTKVEELLRDAGHAPRWRQVNHLLGGGEVPVRYTSVIGGDRIIAIGRDMRPQAAAQQKLLQAQQALERDYIRLRHAEGRYRLLFDQSREAVLIVDAAGRRIREANAAAHRLLGSRAIGLVGQSIAAIAADAERDALIAYLGRAEAADATPPLTVALPRNAGRATVTARAFREGGATQLLVRLDPVEAAGRVDEPVDLSAIVERMPDAFVLTDADLRIIEANTAFADLVQAGSSLALARTALGDWLGRPGIDLELIVGQLRNAGSATNVATILRGATGGQVEVEISAVAADGAYGFVIRDVSRRLRPAAEPVVGLTRSVDQLTELVGRMSLKEIVRESTDLIERLCIEAALVYTEDNRASAAEVLGVSRQSLYSKLHRHGLGDLARDAD